jgi:hypothetical protein
MTNSRNSLMRQQANHESAFAQRFGGTGEHEFRSLLIPML